MTRTEPFPALADGTRRALLERLAREPCTVGELVATVPVSQPAVSQHLKVLREAGLVRFRREGRRHVYRADPEGLAELRRWVEGLWEDVLCAFAAYDEGGGR